MKTFFVSTCRADYLVTQSDKFRNSKIKVELINDRANEYEPTFVDDNFEANTTLIRPIKNEGVNRESVDDDLL